jgi:branched-chain amino acid transport system ATP-binding protein
VLFDVSMNANKEDITVIVGPNGAGKTTLFRTILGLINVYSGDVTLNSHNLRSLPTNRIVKLGVSYVPQRESFFENLTVKENLTLGGYLLDKDEDEKIMEEVFQIFPALKRRDYINKKANKLSGGERRMLSIAMGLMKKPQLLLLDEPTGGLMPSIAMTIFEKINEIHKSGTQVLMTEEKAEIALENGDKAYLLVNGQTSVHGDAKKMLKDPELRDKYFGLV